MYSKQEEYLCTTYEEAVVLADKLFSLLGSKSLLGERTAAKGKVRIRCYPKKGYRVALYMLVEKKEIVIEKKAGERRPRHRNDKKGKHRKSEHNNNSPAT